MNDALNWLLRLDALKPADPGVQWSLLYTLPPWVWALVITASFIAAQWTYRRLEGPKPARLFLGLTRALLLILLVFLLLGPRLIRPSETVEKDWVLVLVDRSASLAIADAPADASSTSTSSSPRTRDDQLRAALLAASPTLQTLARERVVLFMGFDAGAYELKPTAAASAAATSTTPTLPINLTAPVGNRSSLGSALDAALARAAARPVAGVIILSDGRSTDQLSRATLRKLASDRIPVFSFPLGSALPQTDYLIRQVIAPPSAFLSDIVPVQVALQRTGATSATAEVKLRLIDSATNATLDEKTVRFAPGSTNPDQPVTLSARPDTPGPRAWTVRLEPAGPDLLPQNNEARLALALVDRPLRVLYIDGYPRWEYRFLKNILAREKSVSFASTLLAVGRRYLQEGDEDLDAIPSTAQEWAKWDVVMLGDVRPDVFTDQQLAQLKDRVARGGAGLLWIAGEGAVPTAWRTTPLGDLLPMSFSQGEASIRSFARDVLLRPTPLADALGIMRLEDSPANPNSAADSAAAALAQASPFWPQALSDPANTWARLRWVQNIEPSTLKPAVETLAVAQTIEIGEAERPRPSPAVLTMRFGAGRIIYVATDEIWRWRYGRGDQYPERFYLQLLRLLGRESVSRSGKPAVLAISPERIDLGQPARVSAEIVDQVLVENPPASLTVRITRAQSPTAADEPVEPITLNLRPEWQGAASTNQRLAYVATFVAPATGRYTATLTDALLSTTPTTPTDPITAEAEVLLADDEQRQPETDHPLLAQLSTATGGSVLSESDLKNLDRLLPRRELRTTGIAQEHTLWDTPAALLLILVLLTVEWVGRRLIRLP